MTAHKASVTIKGSALFQERSGGEGIAGAAQANPAAYSASASVASAYVNLQPSMIRKRQQRDRERETKWIVSHCVV
jgi:hypothetical protein